MRRDVTVNILYTASTDGHLRSFHVPCLAGLLEHGHAVTAAAAGDGAGLPEGVRFVPVPFTKKALSPANLRAAGMLAGLLRRENFDLVLTHTSLAAFFTRLAVMLCRPRPYVINTVHGYLFSEDTPPLRRGALLLAERLTAGVTDEIVVMNDEDRRIARKCRLCRGTVHLIDGMGVPPERFGVPTPGERAAARRALGLPEGALVLLCAAEFSKRKNQAELLRAMESLPADVYLLLPGEGAELAACRALAASLGVADRVAFPGFAEDLRPYRCAADICVSASRSEGLPFHVTEAMGCGVPCVLSRVKGHADLLCGGGGLLYPIGDTGALVRAVLLLRSSPSLRQYHGALGAQRAQRYALPAVMEPLLSVYERERH